MSQKLKILLALMGVLVVVFAVFGVHNTTQAHASSPTSLGYDDDSNGTSNFAQLKANGTSAVIANDWCRSGTGAACSGYQSGIKSNGMSAYVYKDLTSARTDDCVPAGSGNQSPTTSCITGGFSLDNAPSQDVCPSSVQDAPNIATGIGFCWIWRNHPDWLLKNTNGQYLEEANFPASIETDYGNPAYQQQWLTNVLSDLQTNGWTGVFGDNALVTNNDYGIAEKYQTNAAVDTAMGSMLQAVGPGLKSAGFLFVPNVGYMNIEPQLWAQWFPYTTGEMNQHDVGGSTVLSNEQSLCTSTPGAHCMFNNPNGDGPFDIYDGPAGGGGSPPTVNTDASSGIGTSVATLNGDVNPNSLDTTCHFNYGTSTAYGNTTTAVDEGSGTSDVNFNASLTGLTPDTTYDVQAECSNSAGDVTGSNQQFTTQAVASAPTVNTDGSSGVTQTAATVAGDVNPNGSDTTCHFNYGTTTGYGSTTPNVDEGSGNSDVNLNASLTGLTSSTTYHYQLECSNPAGDATGSDQQFTTAATVTGSAPTVTTDPVSNLSRNTVTLNGTVNPNGLATTCQVNWGRSNPPTNNVTPTHSEGSGTSNVNDSWVLNGLPQHQTFFYQVVCANADGTVNGGVDSFFTPLKHPTVNTDPAIGVTTHNAVVSGDVNPDGFAASCKILYSRLDPPGGLRATALSDEGSGFSDVRHSWQLTGLGSGVRFFYRMDCNGFLGPVLSFQTQ